MALCHKCDRMLSANGSCLYCGTADMSGDRGKPARRKNWIRRILLFVLLALLVHFFFIAPAGRNIMRPLFEKIGLSKYISL